MTYKSLAVFVFHIPCRWKSLSLTPELAAIVAPPDLVEWVLYLEISGTIPLNDALKDSLYAEWEICLSEETSFFCFLEEEIDLKTYSVELSGIPALERYDCNKPTGHRSPSVLAITSISPRPPPPPQLIRLTFNNADFHVDTRKENVATTTRELRRFSRNRKSKART